MKSYEVLFRIASGWMSSMLLADKLRLKDIPQDVRTADYGLYIAALRLSRDISVERFVEDLTVLSEDASGLDKDNWQSGQILRLLADNAWMDDYFGKEVKNLEVFRKGFSDKLLRELSEGEQLRADHLRAEFEKYGLIQREPEVE